MASAILTSLGRIRLFSGLRPASLGCCGLRTRPPLTPVPGEEEDLENEENGEQEMMSMLKKHDKSMRFRRIQRKMEPPGPPERRLTWNAMEQIR
uniref:Uncharacterized protein n=2 Tax=Pyxicephalus adspersus TaxID=30357 RepID=A0AAV3AW80_PYXAD|nr:TPA: hypothetical protein GDO54_007766 [Pyxicephalus adspersus]